MGRGNRHRPARLARKLHAVRLAMDLTQNQLIKRLGCSHIPLHAASISMYESGTREPPLRVLLAYARAAGVPMEFLIDDELDLPDHLPTEIEYEWTNKRKRRGKSERD